MTVQSQQRLALLDKPLHCDAAHVHVQRNVLVSLPVECRSVQGRIARWRVEEKYCAIEWVISHKGSEIFLDRGPFDLAFFGWHGSTALLRRDAAMRDIPGNVVTFPVLQQKWGRWNVGKAIDGKIPQETLLVVDVVPEAIGGCRNEVFLTTTWVVVTEDKEDVRIVLT